MYFDGDCDVCCESPAPYLIIFNHFFDSICDQMQCICHIQFIIYSLAHTECVCVSIGSVKFGAVQSGMGMEWIRLARYCTNLVNRFQLKHKHTVNDRDNEQVNIINAMTATNARDCNYIHFIVLLACAIHTDRGCCRCGEKRLYIVA